MMGRVQQAFSYNFLTVWFDCYFPLAFQPSLLPFLPWLAPKVHERDYWYGKHWILWWIHLFKITACRLSSSRTHRALKHAVDEMQSWGQVGDHLISLLTATPMKTVGPTTEIKACNYPSVNGIESPCNKKWAIL